MQRTKLSKIYSSVCVIVILMYKSEQESERNIQEFSQKMEGMKRGHDLEVGSLEHESQLKRENAEVK